MIYHLCCNQLKSCWEVRDHEEKVVFKGTYNEANRYMKGD